ncbi:type II toxin-antitoxin system RatA family toxin [Uliginosibacterium sp. TH139]|uniref:type II toxin-antitoxin system RatA family toxin n=1 Tax=Uliginosibacterium sp. TH139 TaxID=2067453 RepID=UPI000C7AA844|nr:type II toxin-antitoxin system RatA family toxin [Uliginosibacterium sp. TH139]PLK48869.1 ubiquinone-binding protein [Uliginosibacterium sp. TH139]
MAEIRKSVLVEHGADAMFRLVDGVEDYAAFLPWCGGGEVLERSVEHAVAVVHIRYHGIKAHFSTVNEIEPGRRIRMRLREGPFRKLDGEWNFTPLTEAACKVEFVLHYEFSSSLLEKVLGPVFSQITGSFVEAFIRRADQLAAQGSGAVFK